MKQDQVVSGNGNFTSGNFGNGNVGTEGEKVHLNVDDKLDAYKGEFGVYKPKFKGRYADEYPNRWYDYIIQTLACLPLYIICGLLVYGLLEWGFRDPYSYGWTDFAVFCAYVVMIFVLVFIFGAKRRQREREFIASKYLDNMQKKEKKRLEAEQNAQLLREYRRAMTHHRTKDEVLG